MYIWNNVWRIPKEFQLVANWNYGIIGLSRISPREPAQSRRGISSGMAGRTSPSLSQIPL